MAMGAIGRIAVVAVVASAAAVTTSILYWFLIDASARFLAGMSANLGGLSFVVAQTIVAVAICAVPISACLLIRTRSRRTAVGWALGSAVGLLFPGAYIFMAAGGGAVSASLENVSLVMSPFLSISMAVHNGSAFGLLLNIGLFAAAAERAAYGTDV